MRVLTSWVQPLALALGLVAAGACAAPAVQVTTGQDTPRSAAWAWQAPPNAQLPFAVAGKAKGFAFNASARLQWQAADGRYEAVQEVQMPLLGGRRQSSVGQVTEHGLQPEVFMDRARKEYRVSFDAAAGQIVFSRGSAPAPWAALTQDRVSVFFQVGGMLAAAPQAYPGGTRITVQAASNKSVKPWVFVIDRQETLQLPAGPVVALKLLHLDADNAEAGAQASHSALWLAPQWGYLPVRIRMQESANDSLDLQLQTVPQELRNMSSTQPVTR